MTERPHGYARYRLDGCRCNTCRRGVSEYNRRRQMALAAGTWQPFVDAAPVRAHLRALSRAGIGYKRVAALTGLCRSTVHNMLSRPDRPRPSQKIRPETAAAILALTPADAHGHAADYARIHAAGTQRRIAALAVIGWSLRVQADRVGWTMPNYAKLLRAEKVSAATARLIADLYDQLSMTPAPAGNSSNRTKRWAAASGFLPPLAWDDDTIDDPDARPQLGLLDEDEDGDEGLVWLAVAGHLPVDELPAAERAIARRHLSERLAVA